MTDRPAKAILRFCDVRAGYGALVILDGLSLHLDPGEVLLVLGANGSGKSTLLKTAMGLTQMQAGTIDLGDMALTGMPAHRRALCGLGYVPQTGNVFPELTVADNLRMGAFMCSDGIAAARAAVLDIFPRLGERLTARAGDLSGGERRMLSIALTLMADPKLLLLDEPSSDLSPAMVDLVYASIARIRRQNGVPVLLVEQNIAKGLSIADRVVVMVRGRVGADMRASDVRPGDLHDLFLNGGVAAGAV